MISGARGPVIANRTAIKQVGDGAVGDRPKIKIGTTCRRLPFGRRLCLIPDAEGSWVGGGKSGDILIFVASCGDKQNVFPPTVLQGCFDDREVPNHPRRINTEAHADDTCPVVCSKIQTLSYFRIGEVGGDGHDPARFGPDVDVVAPCLEIPTTDRLGAAGYTPTDYDLLFDGTSAATPHVAALAGLILSLNTNLTNLEVRQIISETTDKINQPAYVYLPTAGKPFGTWNNDVGYGRINAERALLVACLSAEGCKGEGPCGVDIPLPDDCCISPCDPPWRPDEQCLYWYETKFFRVPLRRDNVPAAATFVGATNFIEFRITYEHKLCLLGKQHGPLLYTQTLLPGEKVTLYHSDRYRRITTETDRFSVQTTFMQFLSLIHEARTTNTFELLADRLSSEKGSSSVSVGGGLAGALGFPSGSLSKQTSVTDHNLLKIGSVSEVFNQSVFQATQLTHAERSVVVSTFEEKDVANVTARTIHNDNECRAVTYFIRKVVELYAISTRVSDISYRIIAPNIPPDWHSTDDIGWLPSEVQKQIKDTLKLLPTVGQVVERARPISLPTDGTVYDPELAHCCSCEPERAAAIGIRLEKQKAEALKECLEAQRLQLEIERRKLLLQKGELAPFDATAKATEALVASPASPLEPTL